MASRKGRVVFQPSIFRCQISFREGISIFSMEELVGKQQNDANWTWGGKELNTSGWQWPADSLFCFFLFFWCHFFDGLKFLPWEKHHQSSKTNPFKGEYFFGNFFQASNFSSRKIQKMTCDDSWSFVFFFSCKVKREDFSDGFFPAPLESWKPGRGTSAVTK